jgi:hypothetical protein
LRDHDLKMRNQVVTHGQKVRDMAWMVEPTYRRMDAYISGPKVAPKVSTIIPNLELGKPYVFPSWVARSWGRAMTQTAEDVIKSESLFVMNGIGTCFLT